MDTVMGLFVGLIFFLTLLALYFAPSLIAYTRKHRNLLAIIMLNIFVGWTLLGWVVAIVWSCTKDVAPKSSNVV